MDGQSLRPNTAKKKQKKFSVTDGPSDQLMDGWADRATKQGVESLSTQLKISRRWIEIVYAHISSRVMPIFFLSKFMTVDNITSKK